MDALVEHMEADDIAVGGAGALAVRLEEPPDRPVDVGWSDGGDAPDPVGDRLPLAGALPFLQRPVEALDQIGGEGLVDRVEHEIEHAETVAHLYDTVDGHGRSGSDGLRFEDRPRLLFGEHAAFDFLQIERECDLVLPAESAFRAILALGEGQEADDVTVCHFDTSLDSVNTVLCVKASDQCRCIFPGCLHSCKRQLNSRLVIARKTPNPLHKHIPGSPSPRLYYVLPISGPSLPYHSLTHLIRASTSTEMDAFLLRSRSKFQR